MSAARDRPERAAAPSEGIPPEIIPARVLERLAAEDIHTLTDWRRLSRRERRSIFGVTRAVVEQLDELARGRA